MNAFGYGGTNAHAILESYQNENIETVSNFEKPILIPISAANKDGIKDVAKIYGQFLEENPDANFADIAYTLSRKRSLFEYRMAISARSSQELKNKFSQISQGGTPEGCIQGKTLETKPRLVFVYSGMGPQWWGMGRELLESSPEFLHTANLCEAKLNSSLGWSILEELKKSEENSKMEDPIVAQVANYVIQVSLTNLMKSWGITPDAIIGHSIGEVAAAYASGVLSLEEGLMVAYYRAKIQSSQKNNGTMLAVGLSIEEAWAILLPFEGKISIAAENGPQSITLAGNKEDLQSIVSLLEEKNIFYRFLRVNIAYHSHHMESLQQEVLDALHFLQPKKPTVPHYSTVFGEELLETSLDANYWWQNIRQPVLFGKGIQNIAKKGYQLFVEMGPHPVLASFIKENLMACQVEGETFPSLNRKKQDIHSLMECVGGLFVKGYSIPWDKLNSERGSFIKLPTYPWQKKTYWMESEESKEYRLSSQKHVMLSRRIKSPNPTWQVEINRQFFPWLEDHKIEGTVVFPGAAYIEAGLAIHGVFPCVMEDINFEKMLIIHPEKESILQISLDEHTKVFKVHSMQHSDEWDWTCHATGKFSSHVPKQSAEKLELETLKKTT